jgi:hypothetical protein
MHARFCIRLAALGIFALSPASILAQPPPGTPPRDQQRHAAQTGTAVIRGRVFAGDTGKPLRRARISVSSPELARRGRARVREGTLC